MNETTDIGDLPEHSREHVQALLADYDNGSPFKRALLLETLRLVSGDYNHVDIKMLSKMLAELR
jgi:hypothetical protein